MEPPLICFTVCHIVVEEKLYYLGIGGCGNGFEKASALVLFLDTPTLSGTVAAYKIAYGYYTVRSM
jgi:hypothetical protein